MQTTIPQPVKIGDNQPVVLVTVGVEIVSLPMGTIRVILN